MANKRKSKSSCHAGVVRFKTKRGRVIQFPGHTGTECPKRRKPSTKHLAFFKASLKSAAKKCKGRGRKAFLACVRNEMPHTAAFKRGSARAMRSR